MHRIAPRLLASMTLLSLSSIGVIGIGATGCTAAVDEAPPSGGGDAVEAVEAALGTSATPGVARWTHPLPTYDADTGDPGYSDVARVAVDRAGSAYVAINWSMGVDFGRGRVDSIAGNDAAIAKYDAAGVLAWVRRIASPSSDGDAFVTDLVADAQGNVFASGHYHGALDYAGGAHATATAGHDDGRAFVVAYGRDGAFRWAKDFGGGKSDVVTHLSLSQPATHAGAGEARLLVAGTFGGSVDGLGAAFSAPEGERAIYVSSLSADRGETIFARTLGAGSHISADAIGTDAVGHVIVAGSFEGSPDLGAGPLEGNGGTDVYLVTLSSDGSLENSRVFGGASDQLVSSMAVTPDGSVSLLGTFDGALDFGLGAMRAPVHARVLGAPDARHTFLVRFDATGRARFQKHFGGSGDQHPQQVMVDLHDNVVVVGAFHGGSLTIAGRTFEAPGGDYPARMFMAKFSPKLGTTLWAKSYGDGTNAEVSSFGRSIAAAPDGDYVLGISCVGAIDFGRGPVQCSRFDGTAMIGRFAP